MWVYLQRKSSLLQNDRNVFILIIKGILWHWWSSLPTALFLWFLFIYSFYSPLMTLIFESLSKKSVQLFKGVLTTLWLMCLLWFKHSSPTSALSQSRGGAELLLHTPGARVGDAELSIVALLRINTHWGGRSLGIWWQVESQAFQSILLTLCVSYALWLIFAQGFWFETCGVRQVGHAWFKSKVK